ncbi:FAD-dependent oxidoreductase [Streptomyces albicerus]|uniref:FAD-dependent oxidoreductase n=1 Tax=Streptomyces albicerus TaxID=2569859 RepID=UPI00124B15E6|nr:FAD-dependent oxidoreductase [Streptomyces albicerus]
MSSSRNVLVVGAGIAGLSVARALARRGMSVEIIERRSRPASGMGLFLPANAVRALAELGLQDRVAHLGTPVRSQQLRDSRGATLAEIYLSALWKDTGECVGITHDNLRAALAGAARVPVRTGTTVQSLTEYDSGVHVDFTGGGSGDYDLVVGADGIRSQLRRTVSPGAEPRYAGQICRRFLTDNHHAIDRWTVWLGRGTTFLAVPVSKDRLYCCADLSAPSPQGGEASDVAAWSAERFANRFAGFHPVVAHLLETPEAQDSYVSPIEEVSPRRWATAHTVLVGDAAHATSPNMAQGVAMAVEDALVLAECLDRPGETRDLLEEYRRRRLPRTRWVQAQARKRDRTRGMPPGVRNLLLRLGAERMYESAYAPLRDRP